MYFLNCEMHFRVFTKNSEIETEVFLMPLYIIIYIYLFE